MPDAECAAGSPGGALTFPAPRVSPSGASTSPAPSVLRRLYGIEYTTTRQDVSPDADTVIGPAAATMLV